MLKLSPTPAPIAVMRLRISSDVSTLSRRAFSTLRIFPRSGRIAWVRRSRPPFAVPPARVTFDDVELAMRRIALGAVGQLAGQRARLEEALALHQVAGLARGFTRARRGQRLLDDAAAVARVFLEVLRQALGQRRWTTWPWTSALPSLPLV